MSGQGAAPTPPTTRGFSRREAINYTLVALASAAGGGSAVWLARRSARDAVTTGLLEIFKKDAPTGELWEAWKRRGWVKEGYHYLKLGKNVQCKICPNNCLLEPGDRSHCRDKVNVDGVLYTLVYGNPCTFHVDPVEKKPLFHFLPGSRTFSLATAGCVFRCLNCQNWEISQKKPEETKDPFGPELRLRPPVTQAIGMGDIARLSMFPDDVVAVAEWAKCPSISYTYSDPVAFFEYTYDTCKLARERKLKNIMVTCGSMDERALRDIGQFVDAAHVDLKGFDDDVYWKLNAGSLDAILNILKTMKSMGIWFELINLVIPTYTDKPDMIARMCGWIVKNLGPDQPIHFSRFHPQHKLSHLPPTPVEMLLQAQDIARRAGLRYAYVGNVPGLPDAETTFCPNCKRAVVTRDIYTITGVHLDGGKCKFCQTAIAGVWTA
ncbi:MAG: AmmeMemoRadiSam system radical SAM enzyme [Verrucomicrobia bacterium]|nr:AmmeMemoRadiSam system radical SAM enzyme [Verrucomicrobiota bacterium]